MPADPTLDPFNQLLGTWTTEATHPKMPGVVVHGTATIEWLEGKQFLILRADTDHPDFPDSISIIGRTEHDRIDPSTHAVASTAGSAPLHMQYFDERGVFRINETRFEDAKWRWWRDAPGFSQRFTGTFTDSGDTIVGLSQLREDDVHWTDDLEITYRRQT
ncbi:MAG: hypothetical protein ABJB74_18045 [Gemmatimonas sp.]